MVAAALYMHSYLDFLADGRRLHDANADTYHWAREDTQLYRLCNGPADGRPPPLVPLVGKVIAACATCAIVVRSSKLGSMVFHMTAAKRMYVRGAESHGAGDQQNRHHW